MRYPAHVTREGNALVVVFPSCPGCQTQADPGEDVDHMATEALQGWLEVHLLDGEAPPRPPRRTPRPTRGASLLWVEVPAKLAVKLYLRWARQEAGLTQAELAERAGVSQPMVAKLERPDYNPTLDTLEKVAQALGVKLRISLEAA
jgi:HTH-type transcriptional regulator/antitoxin HipB